MKHDEGDMNKYVGKGLPTYKTNNQRNKSLKLAIKQQLT